MKMKLDFNQSHITHQAINIIYQYYIITHAVMQAANFLVKYKRVQNNLKLAIINRELIMST